MKCTRCGKENPADVHTCSLPKALALADMIEEDPMTTWGYREASHEAAAELRRLHADNEALREALQELALYVAHNGDDWVQRKARAALARAGEVK
jgi:hypothetical protein